jgi:hypothetical protein
MFAMPPQKMNSSIVALKLTAESSAPTSEPAERVWNRVVKLGVDVTGRYLNQKHQMKFERYNVKTNAIT